MPSEIKWETAASRDELLTTQLNSLADQARIDRAGEIDNTDGDQLGVLELNVTFGTAPDSGGYVLVYFVKALDGTNYEDGSSTVEPAAEAIIAHISLRATTSAQRRMSRPFELPPCKFSTILLNESGQSFPASGSTLHLLRFNPENQ